MIQIYADGVLTYDSRVEEWDLLGLTITTGLNKGGTAEITMPASHLAYMSYAPYRTIVEIKRDGDLRFRGRVLYNTYNFDNTLTVTCEGEMCFLQDYYYKPYKHTKNDKITPRDMLYAVITYYNTDVDDYKRFTFGKVDVQAAFEEFELESEEAETALDIINKLIELCGGYIVFNGGEDGTRTINWLAAVGNDCGQTIDAGENLFDLSRTYANTEMCTIVRPYGAKGTNGKRLDITSANNGSDTLRDEEAISLRGKITRAPVWDEVTDVYVLKSLAQQYLDDHKQLINSMTVSALDLSYIDKSLDSFKLGDMIRVVSKAHGVDGRFQLAELTEDLLNPDRSLITLGKETKTLTGLGAAGVSSTQRGLLKAVAHVKGVTQQTEADLSASIEALNRRLLILENPEYNDGTDNV